MKALHVLCCFNHIEGTRLCIHSVVYNWCIRNCITFDFVQQSKQMFLWLMSQLQLREDQGQDLRPMSK